jgi:hypothetical protein
LIDNSGRNKGTGWFFLFHFYALWSGKLELFASTATKPASIIFWLKDESLEESDNLLNPDVLAQEIVEDLEAALKQFAKIGVDVAPNENELIKPD